VAQGRIASKDPLVLGHEFAGTVEKVGSDVAHLRAGDRVTVMPLFPHEQDVLRNGLPSYARATMMGVHHDGAFSELAIAPAKSVYKLPDHVSFMQGAYMEPIAASMAVLNASIHAGQKGLVFGDNRISRLTERVLRAKGFDNITVCSSEDTLEDNAYDFVVETLATTETMQRMVRSVRPGGRIVLKSRQHTPISINVNDLVLKDVAMEAVSYGDFAQGIELIASGKLAIDDLFGDVYPLERFETVFAHANRGETKKLFFSAAGPDVWTC
jgi:L-iditol 2-dehydrogenase